jgi:hypothetical protein
MNKQTLYPAFIVCLLLPSAAVLLAGNPAARPAGDDLSPAKGWKTARLLRGYPLMRGGFEVFQLGLI